MKLFALLATISVDATRLFSRNFVESYLKSQFSAQLVESSLIQFDEQLNLLSDDRGHSQSKRLSSLSVKILMICNEVNQELHLKSKYLILFSIIQFSKYFEANLKTKTDVKSVMTDAVDTIAGALQINEAEYRNCQAFISDRFFKVPERSSLLVVSGNKSIQFSDIKHYRKEGLKGQFFFLKIPQADLYIFYYVGKESIEMGGKVVFPNHVYLLPKGAALKSAFFKPLYYGDVVSAFSKSGSYSNIYLEAREIDFRYPNSDNGVHEMNLLFEAGEMIGVMGGSGTGKSTLMAILNGNIETDSGGVFINGKSIIDNSEELEGLVGFVPQDDLLIEELTVFENLYYNAKLCLGGKDEKDIITIIARVLNKLGLFYIKDLTVGSTLNKYISGGQRKRLNIALELIREPSVLFVDEPTSGLSSTDSENVLSLLKEQALSGKIVVINIHQPSSELFKLFNKIVIMDKGGYPVYFGNPLESVSYLKNVANRADAAEIECITCGNVQTEDILKIIESKKVNEFGEFTDERLLEPEDWYRLFKSEVEQPLPEMELVDLPELNFKIPSRPKQFSIYSRRNFFTKLADKQFVALALTITPILALLLGFFTRHPGGMEGGSPVYVFSLNENLPAYLFMCVLVSLFVGLIISAEEIIRDRKIRSREAFLNLSKFSYFNSKIVFLFALSAFQMLVFVIIGNLILGIKGLNFNYWIILFSTSCFAVLLGLNISAGLKSIISIYINIPFVMVPLILLSGIIVQYDKIHQSVSGDKYVPLVGNVMASRWGYEALMVNQFKNNEYEKHFFEVDKKQGNALYYVNFLIPELDNRLYDLKDAIENGDEEKLANIVEILANTLPQLEGFPESLHEMSVENLDIPLIEAYLDQLKAYLIRQSNVYTREKDAIYDQLLAEGMTKESLIELRRDFHNESIAEVVLNTGEMNKIKQVDASLIRKETPIYQMPDSRIGRAPFYASSKLLGNWEVNTILFNIMVLWLMTIILYIALVNDWLKKVIAFTSGAK